ncbi:ATP-binding protein [Pseudoxanthomonas winnipegensis]|uniref:hypothetical protein n=1 Tax=Pseudoxanthomonas winnipegensis TaxID=2480810 RepID=UPI002574D6AE|nr:hypothetical protein [Pseudoxanthomonas winnipegensis]WJI16097.1 ATP-binding protein [Pseudoxanthomonas winnipegensis]
MSIQDVGEHSNGTSYGADFPIVSVDAIERHHVLETISAIATDEVPVVFVEGVEGCGATTLLAQFCVHEPQHCFYLFVKPASKFSYSVEYLRRLLAEQYSAYVGRELASDSAVDVSEYNTLLLAVRKKRGIRPIYFVIDGLHQVPQSDERRIESIFYDVLPLGTHGFRFLITGDAERFSRYISTLRYKSYQVQKLSPTESKLLLKGLNIPDNKIDSILKICKGLPGRLASVRKLMASGVSSDELLNADPCGYPDFIAMEFAASKSLSETQRLMLATLAFSRYPLSINKLKLTCQGSDDDIRVIFEACGFIVQRTELGICEFESETYRRFAASSLDYLRHKSISLQIEHLSSNPGTPEAIQFLPAYLSSINQQQSIIDMLVPEHYSQLLSTTKSISSLRARAALGARSASQLKQAQQIFQFALQRSIFSDVAFASGHKSKIGALVAIGEAAKALDMALSTSVNEIQIQMLAEYAARKREESGAVENQIIESIRELADKVDFSGISDDLESLAENVAFFDADLAIAILDKASLDEGQPNQRNNALVNLSLAAAAEKGEAKSAIIEKTRNQVSDERHKSIISFISGYFGDLTISQIEEIAGPMKVGRKIYFLRCVLAGPSIGDNALDIVDYALSQAINNSSYLPRMRDLADFATPLTYVQGQNTKVSELVTKFDGQMGLVQESSGSVARVSLGMKLAIGCSRYDPELARKRVLDLYYESQEVDSLEARAECFALILKGLGSLSSFSQLDAQERISEVLRDELQRSLIELLKNTASHFEVVRRPLAAIAEYSSTEALALIEKLNTTEARDKAYEYVASVVPSFAYTDERGQSLNDCIRLISESRIRDNAVVSAVRSGVRGKDPLNWSTELTHIIRSVRNPVQCSDAVVALIRSQLKHCDRLDEELLFRLETSAKNVGSELDRAEIFYQAVSVIGKSFPDQARKFFAQAEESQGGSLQQTGTAERIKCTCLSLVLRSSRVLIKFGQFDDSYLARFTRLCAQIKDPVTRTSYLADLAIKGVCEGDTDLAKKIIDEHCNPLIAEYATYEHCRNVMRGTVFTPLFLIKGRSALVNIEALDRYERDDRLNTTLDVILKNSSESDHWTGDFENCAVSLSAAEDCVLLIDEMRCDLYISSAIRNLVAVLLSKGSRSKITAQQRADLRSRLLGIARKKLPVPDGVAHEGYLIEVEAYLQRLSDGGDWHDLLVRASAIGNLADRVLVQMEIANSMPGKLVHEARTVLSRVKDEVTGIPSPYDRHGRIEAFIEAAKRVDPLLTKAALKDAMSFSFYLDDEQAANRSRRKLLDSAEQIDPKMLDELIAEVDDDPARASARADLARQAKIQKARRRISSVSGNHESEDVQRDVLPAAAWKSVGSLVSGRSEAIIPDRLCNYVAACGDWDLNDAFPVLSWYIENISRRLMRQEDVSQKVSPLWEVLMLSTELSVNLMERTSVSGSRLFSREANGLIVKRGAEGHGDAVSYLRAWLGYSEDSNMQVIFCDPFFSPADIDLIRIVSAQCPMARLVVLTSRKALISLEENAFERAWNQAMDQNPPAVEVIGISDLGDNRSPVHDRWLLLPDKGLRLGTSFSGLGSRLSEISELDDERTAELLSYLSHYVRGDREVDGRRVGYIRQTF